MPSSTTTAGAAAKVRFAGSWPRRGHRGPLQRNRQARRRTLPIGGTEAHAQQKRYIYFLVIRISSTALGVVELQRDAVRFESGEINE
jgi:hypothetical protein